MFPPDDIDEATAAYHEAGHVMMAHLLSGNVVYASIESDDGQLMGVTKVIWKTQPDDEQRRCSALVALAGPLAESRWRGESLQLEEFTAWRGDWQEVQNALVEEAHGRDPVEVLQQWMLEVRCQLDDPLVWEWLCRVADALEAHGTLDDVLLDDALERD